MLRQVGIGALAVLSVGLLAVGCSDDGDTIIMQQAAQGGIYDLSNFDTFPASSVASNNLSPDNGGFSPNDEDLFEFLVVFNSDVCGSDGPFTGDGTAMVLFMTQDLGTADWRVFASHYEAGTFTPPVELLGEDRDYSMRVQLNTYVCIPLNTSTYQAATNTNEQIAARNNAGNWLILGEYISWYIAPSLAWNGAGGNMTTTNARGPRNVLASWVFNHDLRGSSWTTSTSVGSVTREFEYGFQKDGEIVNTTFQGGGAAVGNVPVTTSPSATPCSPNHVVSYGAITDGFAGQATFGGTALPFSDGGATGAYAPTAIAGNTPGLVNFSIAIPNVGPGGAVVPGNLAARWGARYTVGEAVTYLRAVWVQVCNSFSGGGTFTSATGGQAGGAELQMRSKSFNLATMAWENDEAEIVPPRERNPNNTNLKAGTAPFPIMHVYNNQLFYKYADGSLVSLNATPSGGTNALALHQNTGPDWFQSETGGHHGGLMAGGDNFWEEIIAVTKISDDGDGTNSFLSANNAHDLSHADTRSSQGQHTLDNPSFRGGTGTGNDNVDIYPADREMADFLAGTSIFGSDEGMAETVIFFVMTDNSNTTSNSNIDRELLAAAFQSNGAFVQGTNPHRISGTHQLDYHMVHGTAAGALHNSPGEIATALPTWLRDGIAPLGFANGQAAVGTSAIAHDAGANQHGTDGMAQHDNPSDLGFSLFGSQRYARIVVNRTGEYIALLFLKNVGTSVKTNSTTGGYHQALHVVAYQPYRATVGTTGTTAAADFHTRFDGPDQVSGTLAITAPGGLGDWEEFAVGDPGTAFLPADSHDAAMDHENWDSLPVNNAFFQGRVGYRCGFQSDKERLTIMYEQSDSTEDRVFFRQIRVVTNTNGTPTMTFTAASAELHSTASVDSHASYEGDADRASSNAIQGRTRFTFIDGTVPGSNWQIVDAIDSDGDATRGDVICFFWKITSNTNNATDAALLATIYDGTGFSDENEFGRAVVSNHRGFAAATAGVNAFTAGITHPQNSDNDNGAGAVGGYAAQILNAVCVPNNSDIVNAPSYPLTNTANAAVYVYFTDNEGRRTISGGAVTVRGNGQDQKGLFTRKYRPNPGVVGTTTTAETVAQRADPDWPNTSPDGAEPTRLHHRGSSDDVNGLVATVQDGVSVLVLYEQNEHLWGQWTGNGVDYQKDANNNPNPALVDHLSSENVRLNKGINPAGGSTVLFSSFDANNDTKDGIVGFSKDDKGSGPSGANGDERLYFRGKLTF